MNLNFKTFCAVSALCFSGSVFSMDHNSIRGSSSDGSSSQFRSVDLKGLSYEDLLRVATQFCRDNESLRQENKNLNQKLSQNEEMLAEVLDQTIHTKSDRDDEIIELFENSISSDGSSSSSSAQSDRIEGAAADTSSNSSEKRKNRANRASSSAAQNNVDKVRKFYNYCQDKNTPISISDLIFDYDINQKGLFNCKVTLNGEVFDQNMSCITKKEAKNEILGYVYDVLMERDKNRDNQANANWIAQLNEYCQDKSTHISLSDLIFDYEITKYGYFNCTVTLNGEVFDLNLNCKSKKAAKNEICKYVYNVLMERDKNRDNQANANWIAKLSEYCDDKSTPISLSDLDFGYEITKEGRFNCKVTLNGEVFDLNLNCKSKKAAKNEICKYVYNVLVEKDKNRDNQASSSAAQSTGIDRDTDSDFPSDDTEWGTVLDSSF